MSILPQLQSQKGAVSSVIGKKLAEQVLKGDMEILVEAIELCTYDLDNIKAKGVRSGAVKIVEIVAEKKPEAVESYLQKILPALNATEPQTRWMAIRIMGFCAALNPGIAARAIPIAEKFVTQKTEGLCLASSADLFLGDYGALSRKAAGEILPVLKKSTHNILLNEHDWLLEAFTKILDNLSIEGKKEVVEFAAKYVDFPRKSTQTRAKKLLQKIGLGKAQ
jgi:hypothetical protein